MEKTSDRFIDKLIVMLTTLWLVSFTVFSTETWGKYVYLGLTVVIFGLGAIGNGWKVNLAIEPFHLCTMLFLLYGFASYLWAIDGTYTIKRMSTVAQTLICMYFVYTYYREDKDSSRLLDCVMWAGYIVAIYAIYYYGLNTIRSLIAAGDRIDNEFTNVNEIGMMAAYSLIITFSRIVNKHFSGSFIFSLPALLMVIASGSRKAFIILLFGVLFVYLTRSVSQSSNQIETLFKFFLVCSMGAIAIIIIWSIPAFKPVTERLLQTLNQLTGNGKVDESTIRRVRFIEIGWQQFIKTPIQGIGIGNSLFIIGRNTYLHSNYIEILACGGILGILTFYSSYLYCLKELTHGMKNYNEITTLCVTFFILQLVMDFMQVSYFSKDTFFYFMIFFLQTKRLRNNLKTCNRKEYVQ